METLAKHTSRSALISDTLFSRLYVLMACISCGAGAVILGGGAPRFSGDEFKGARDLVNWMPFFDSWVYWGALFLLHGLGVGYSLQRPIAKHVLRFGIVVYTFLAFTLVYSLTQGPTVAAFGCVLCFGIAVLALFLSDHLEQHGWGG